MRFQLFIQLFNENLYLIFLKQRKELRSLPVSHYTFWLFLIMQCLANVPMMGKKSQVFQFTSKYFQTLSSDRVEDKIKKHGDWNSHIGSS